MAEHPLNVVERPAGFEHPRDGLMAQIVEVEIDGNRPRGRLAVQVGSRP